MGIVATSGGPGKLSAGSWRPAAPTDRAAPDSAWTDKRAAVDRTRTDRAAPDKRDAFARRFAILSTAGVLWSIVVTLAPSHFAMPSAALHAAPPKPRSVEPAQIGLDPQRLAEIDAIVAEGLAENKMPGCVVLVGRHDQIGLLKAYGLRRKSPEPEPMTADTVFDLASLTKPIATATSVMRLVERGKLRLDARASEYLPEFQGGNKERITVEQLLVHQGGLIADNALDDYRQGPAEAWRKICELTLRSEPGSKFVYSDVSFIVLGKLVERVSGQPLNEFARDNLFQPLDMKETGYLPGEALRARAAPTQQRDGRWMQGEVHDPRAHLMGGVAGHAGLFSTASDLAIFATAMSDAARCDDASLLSADTWRQMTAPRTVSTGLRALGWDMKTGYSINRGTSMSEQAFGHGGFTGTAIWIDPASGRYVVFLSNRVHPDGKGLVNPLIGKIGTVVSRP